MKFDNAIYYPDTPQGRADFRQHLVGSILESKELRKHPAELQEKFLFMLSNVWGTKDLKIERDRKRSIEKVGNDAQRLRHAISALQDNDKITLDYESWDSPLSELSRLLTELYKKSDLLAKAIQGEHAEIRKTHFDLKSADIVQLLQLFEIPCTSRNDHPSTKESIPNKTVTGKLVPENTLPPIHKNITIGMRCVMLALLDAGEENLSWTTTCTILKHEEKMQKKAHTMKSEMDLHCTFLQELNPLKLYTLENPLWKYLKLGLDQ